MGLKEVCISSFIKYLGFLEEDHHFSPSSSKREKKEDKYWFVCGYQMF